MAESASDNQMATVMVVCGTVLLLASNPAGQWLITIAVGIHATR